MQNSLSEISQVEETRPDLVERTRVSIGALGRNNRYRRSRERGTPLPAGVRGPRTLPERLSPRVTSCPPCLSFAPSFTLHFLIGEVKTIGSLHLDLFVVQTGNCFIFGSCVTSGANPLFAFVQLLDQCPTLLICTNVKLT